MLVYGDRSQIAKTAERLAEIDQQLAAIRGMPAGVPSHSKLVSLLIESGQLLQGIVDADFASVGQDRRTVQSDRLGAFVHALAQCVCRSWSSAFASVGELPRLPRVPDLPSSVELRTPEGFAFYAVYPEAYVEAARTLRLSGPARVIGIRSIGTTLSSVVAAALAAPAPFTVRPYGDPFQRRVAIAPDLEQELLAHKAHFVVVDEGPGLSGSSFGAVADWLQERDVPLDRIAFLPSHAGALGPQASEAHRRRWQKAQRVPADFAERLPGLAGEWAAELIGPLDDEPLDISGGKWRAMLYSSEADWPAINPTWERRKFLVRAGGEPFLVKFAGLGSIGQCKLGMARALHSAGFAAEPVGLAYGFLVERWQEGARPLPADEKPLAELAHYIGARARLFPAQESTGASLNDLLDMARQNLAQDLGALLGRDVDSWRQRLDQLSRRTVRVRTDNRLDRHKWLNSSGRLLKTDALDHHAGHDLIGCQDVAWDVAGAIVEFRLGPTEARQLIAATERASGRHVDCEMLEFYSLAYRAFRLGQATMSVESGAAAGERERLQRDACRYRETLQQPPTTPSATRQESLIG